MSCSDRGGENANSALLVTLHPEDFPYEGTLGGMYWQREIERRAFALSGDYKACAQTVGGFLRHESGTGSEKVTPSYRPGVHWCELHELLPERITSVLEAALPELGKSFAALMIRRRCSQRPRRAPPRRCGYCAMSAEYHSFGGCTPAARVRATLVASPQPPWTA